MARTAALASHPSPKVVLLTFELSAFSGCILLLLTSFFNFMTLLLLLASVLCVSSNSA